MRALRRRTAIIVAVIGVSVALAGCALEKPTPAPTASTSSAAPAPEETAAPDPVFDPAGGAAANQAYFDFVNRRSLAQNPDADGRAFIDGLVAAGFDRSRMEVTYDSTPTDLAADSIQFSVRFDDGCLIGQNGEVSKYLSQVRAALSTGRCLIGETRPIDW